MDKADVIRISMEVGLINEAGDSYISIEDMQRFANLVAVAERERILDMCKEGLWDGEGIRFHLEKRGQE